MAPSKTPSPVPPSIRLPPPDVSPSYTDPTYDPVDFLNDVLPPLALQSQSQLQSSSRTVNLSELSARVQNILSQTNAHNVRHSTALTTLTDEILRSGGRLAYEVEVLRGETISLSELVSERLSDEIGRFVGENTGLESTPTSTPESGSSPGEQNQDQEQKQEATAPKEPDHITNLRTLTIVRARLEEIIRTFGQAMEWPLPPSETSLASSFISVSAPDTGPDSHSREEKGQEVAKKLRAEITGLLDSEPGLGGVEAATRRVEELRVLAMVWKGTAEEKARSRFVEGLAKVVEERRRAIEFAAQPQGGAVGASYSGRGHQRQESEGPGGGIFRNLQRLRDEIYLE
ncbi:hypothetical protein BJX61DRAFT_132894 [Aspergillus egyptiacus]|nr:hypothetical protein BJX61DRAFT_132894 [Aspergillus egyptiacus]